MRKLSQRLKRERAEGGEGGGGNADVGVRVCMCVRALLGDARARAAELVAQVKSPMINTVGETTLAGFAAIVGRAALLVTTESGAMHIASATGTPTYVLFSQIYDYRQFTPYGVPNAFSLIDVPCARCIYGCPAMTCMQHAPADVIASVIRFADAIPACRATSTGPQRR